ncbi:retrovirus-related pol polyprotein from transposon TNT 1-94, partial [Tanacetum coccineum]
PLDIDLDSACKYAKRIQEVQVYVTATCHSLTKPSKKLVSITPLNRTGKVRFADQSETSKEKTQKQVTTIEKQTTNNSLFPSTGQSVLNANSKLICDTYNECMFDAIHDSCVRVYLNDVNARVKFKFVKSAKRRTFTIVRNTCPLTRITSTKVVPLKETTSKSVITQNPDVKVYSRRPKATKSVVQIILWYLDSGCSKHMTRNRSQLINFVHKFIGTVRFGNNQIAKIMGHGLVPKSSSLTPYVPPTKKDYDILFQPMFDEYFNPSPSVASLVPAVVALDPTDSTGLPSSTSVDQDAPSPNNDPFFGVLIPEPNSEESSSRDVILINVHLVNQPPEHLSKWTKDHRLDNVIGNPSRPVSTRHQLQNEALFCHFDAFLTFVEPKSYKEALKESCWIEAMKEELNEFERLKTSNFSKSEGIFLNQSKYALEIIKKYGMKTSDPVDTPMAKPTKKYLHAVKQIFTYLKGTINMGLWYSKDSFIALTAFADADHAGCQDTKRSTPRKFDYWVVTELVQLVVLRNRKAQPYPIQKLNTLPYPDVVLKSFG